MNRHQAVEGRRRGTEESKRQWPQEMSENRILGKQSLSPSHPL